jgi:acyl transferase domain-containing protein
VVGLLKTCLMQREGRVLPQRGPAEVSPDLGLDASGLRIATEEHAWPRARPLAAVNSLGYGGTNAHVIVAPASPRTHDAAAPEGMGPTLVPLSAYSEVALRARAADVIRWLDGGGDAGDLGFTLARRRSHLTARACVVAGSRAELRGALEALRDGRDTPEVVKGTASAGVQVKTC